MQPRRHAGNAVTIQRDAAWTWCGRQTADAPDGLEFHGSLRRDWRADIGEHRLSQLFAETGRPVAASIVASWYPRSMLAATRLLAKSMTHR